MPFSFTKYTHLITILCSILLIAAGCASTQQSAQPSPAQPEIAESADDGYSAYQSDRPVPNAIDNEVPNAFYRAADNNTRTFSGKPGHDYWQQRANYNMNVALIPDQKKVVGNSTITYYNNSPDTLGQLFLELAQNVHKQGAIRNESAEVTGGMNITNAKINGESISLIQQQGQRGYFINGTLMAILPNSPVLPGDSVIINLDFDFKIPQQGAGGRFGYSRDNLFFIAYWYPKMRVYDDVNGWFTDPFQINSEFYHGFADYQVNITAPEQWVVTSTGALNNAKDVLTTPVYERLQKAYSSDNVVNVVGEQDFENVTQPGSGGTLTWRFNAEDVRDFAFSVTKESKWDATRTAVGDLDEDGQTDYTHIDALYRSSAPLWKDAAKHNQHAIKFLSKYTGLSYPWPHMTAIEGGGIIGGGMEFPMMTLIGAYNGQSTQSLYAVIAHELAHMWVPMQVSTNERRYAWFDEGTTTFNENQSKKDYYPDAGNPDISDFQSYLQIAGTDFEGPIMRWSDYHYNGFAYGIASYQKPASMLVSLRGLLGQETFKKAFERFLKDWQYKHPYPWDFFNTFEDVSGKDLDWFWRSWYYETWILDQAVESVTQTDRGTRITIQDYGQVPMPANITITLADGTTLNRTIKVDTWLNGATTAVLLIENDSEVTKVEIDPEQLFPDADRTNNSWGK